MPQKKHLAWYLYKKLVMTLRKCSTRLVDSGRTNIPAKGSCYSGFMLFSLFYFYYFFFKKERETRGINERKKGLSDLPEFEPGSFTYRANPFQLHELQLSHGPGWMEFESAALIKWQFYRRFHAFANHRTNIARGSLMPSRSTCVSQSKLAITYRHDHTQII